jgi:uncharacterized protein YjbI with pentapeptide repeats
VTPANSDRPIKQILQQHQQWLESGGEQGERADLRGWDAGAACLNEVSLQRALLRGADLRGCQLRYADLSGAELEQVQFGGADLTGANLSGARLEQASGLAEAMLRYCRLDGVSGLNCQSFRNADLTGVTLPAALSGFAGLSYVASTSQLARPIFLFLIVTCLFSALTELSTSDAALLTNAPSAVLPNLSTTIPAASFFWTAPFLLLFIYCYLHLYLVGVWRTLALMPARFPDGSTLEIQTYPWLLYDLVSLKQVRFDAHRSLMHRVRSNVVVMLIWGMAPLTLLLFWWGYLARHDLVGTQVHILMVVFSLWLSMVLYAHAVNGLRDREVGLWEAVGGRAIAALFALWLGMSLLSVLVIYAPLLLAFWHASPQPEDVSWLVGTLDHQDLSVRPGGWDGKDIARIDGVDLARRDFSFAHAEYAFFVNADLRKARLQRANLLGSDFRGANLEKAKLDGANMDMIDFRQACLRKAKFRPEPWNRLATVPMGHSPKGAADLENATFEDAYLGRAEMPGAELREADFHRAYMQGIDLRGAVMDRARLQQAFLGCYRWNEGDEEKVRCADLSGASLKQANLTGARLRCAKLSGADLSGALLSGADLSGADLSTTTGVQQSMLNGACGDDDTRLPDGLSIAHCAPENRSVNAMQTMATVLALRDSPNPCWQNMLHDTWPLLADPGVAACPAERLRSSD